MSLFKAAWNGPAMIELSTMCSSMAAFASAGNASTFACQVECTQVMYTCTTTR